MKKILYSLCLFLSGAILFVGFLYAKTPKDWLKDAYKQSHTNAVSNEPYSSDIESDDLFQQSTFAVGGSPDNVMVRFTRFIMRTALVIAITMLIFVGIKIGLAMGDSGNLQEALQLGGKVVLGVFIILASVAIVFLVSSLTRGSLDYELFR